LYKLRKSDYAEKNPGRKEQTSTGPIENPEEAKVFATYNKLVIII